MVDGNKRLGTHVMLVFLALNGYELSYKQKFQEDLRTVTGNEKLRMKDFQRYWASTDLETAARGALMPPPTKDDLTDEQIKEIVVNLFKLKEAEMGWFLNYLKMNTEIENLTDYLFEPGLAGLAPQASLEQIADKIIADRK